MKTKNITKTELRKDLSVVEAASKNSGQRYAYYTVLFSSWARAATAIEWAKVWKWRVHFAAPDTEDDKNYPVTFVYTVQTPATSLEVEKINTPVEVEKINTAVRIDGVNNPLPVYPVEQKPLGEWRLSGRTFKQLIFGKSSFKALLHVRTSSRLVSASFYGKSNTVIFNVAPKNNAEEFVVIESVDSLRVICGNPGSGAWINVKLLKIF